MVNKCRDGTILLTAFVAQLGERTTEDRKVAGSIPAGGIFYFVIIYYHFA
jgi:hypothetical protein